MKNIKHKLTEKGWSKKHINEAIAIIEKAKKNKHHKIKLLDKSVYYISLVVAITGNFIISVALIPMLLALKGIVLYITVITIALAFGLLFELLLRTMEHLETKHHIFFGVIIPIIAIINFVNIVIFSNRIETIIKIQNPQNPLLIGLIYTISFIVPYAVYQIFLKDVY